RRLVDVHHFVEQVQPFHLAVWRDQMRSAVDLVGGQRKQRVVDQRRFARAGDAGDTGQQTGRDGQVDTLEVVAGGAAQVQRHLRVGLVPSRRNLDGALARQVLAGQRARRIEDVLQ